MKSQAQSRLVSNLKFHVIFLPIFISGLFASVVQSAATKKPQLCQGHYHSEQAAKEQLAKFVGSYSSFEQWKARAAL